MTVDQQTPRPEEQLVPAALRAQILAGLEQEQKTLPCKLLYDSRGGQLFERICRLREYYLTRCELAILRHYGGEIAHFLGSECLLVEYGSGSSRKTRVLLSHLDHPAGYVPIDIAHSSLLAARRQLQRQFPKLPITPLWADYTNHFELPEIARPVGRTVAYFPGSSIGNFEPQQAVEFLQRIAGQCGPGSGLLIGVDLKKDPDLLHRAYNDRRGVTAQFNVNILRRLNRELGAGFDLERFRHYAFYHRGRVEMHLVSRDEQMVRVCGRPIEFAQGQSICTESCWKYSLDEFAALAEAAGYRRQRVWLDYRQWFSVQYFLAEN